MATISNDLENTDFINNDSITTESSSFGPTKKPDTNSNDPSLVEDATPEEVNQEKSTKHDIKEATKKTNEQKSTSLGKVIGGLGGSQPLIQINDYTFSSREIVYFEINQSGFLPTCEITLQTTTGKFISRSFPKDADVISIFIRSYNDVFKPISNDYLITNVETSRSVDTEGSMVTIFLDGILNVNYLFSEICKGIKNKTSFESLIEISDELNLGFASNESSTNDKMNWLSCYDTYKDWIDDIVLHSYKDDTSFFDSWIDYYYNFNFVNLNKIFSINDTEEAKDGIVGTNYQIDHNPDDNITKEKTSHHFTNDPSHEKSNYYYDSLELINAAGEINILNGYKRYIHFYDIGLKDEYQAETHTTIFVDPLITDGSEVRKNVMKGRPQEDIYKNTFKRKWQGIQYSNEFGHNVHPYWKLSEYINFQNYESVHKMMLKIHLPKCNFNIYRGQRIPLSCMITNDPERIKVAGNIEDDAKSYGFTMDRFLSANNYVILGISIIYEMIDEPGDENVYGRFRQELLLGRREWEIPDSPFNGPETI